LVAPALPGEAGGELMSLNGHGDCKKIG
jgi:hypothetical protein